MTASTKKGKHKTGRRTKIKKFHSTGTVSEGQFNAAKKVNFKKKYNFQYLFLKD
jgi:hypothetical protein